MAVWTKREEMRLQVVGTSRSVHEGSMDTTEPVAIETSNHTKRRRRTIEEKRRIVEDTREDF
jgi:hypothetical protein